MDNRQTVTLETTFRANNGNYFPQTQQEGAVVQSLPPAIYTVNFHPEMGFYVSKIADNTELPPKLYNTGYEMAVSRIAQFHEESTKAVGAIFTGPAGVGKTIESKRLQSIFINDKKLPVFLISNSYAGQAFMNFINQLGDGLFIFDEFEKVYTNNQEPNSQNSLLSMFDGSDSMQKRLSVIIVNEFHRLSSYYKDRPGRANFLLEWKTLPLPFIEEYLKDNLINKEVEGDFKRYIEAQGTFTFDLLQSITRECNYHNGKDVEFPDIIKYLNVPQATPPMYFKAISLIFRGEDYSESMVNGYFYIDEIGDTIFIDIDASKKGKLSEKTFSELNTPLGVHPFIEYYTIKPRFGSELLDIEENSECKITAVMVTKEEYEENAKK